jgi:hypothetical protein
MRASIDTASPVPLEQGKLQASGGEVLQNQINFVRFEVLRD